MRMARKETIPMVALVVLVSLLDGHAGSRIFWALVREHWRKRAGGAGKGKGAASYETFRNAMNRLAGDGLVVRESDGEWKITKAGRAAYGALVRKKGEETRLAEKRKEGISMVIVFDIPEKDRKKRAYLRFELVALGFRLLQKSVWVGPGPVPESFVRTLRDMDMIANVHMFSIAKKGTISAALP